MTTVKNKTKFSDDKVPADLSTPFYVVSTSEWWVWHSEGDLTCIQETYGAKVAAARHLEAGPPPCLYSSVLLNLKDKLDPLSK